MTLQEIYNSQTDKTSVSLSNQSLQFELDELGLKSRYNQDLKYVEESQRNIKEQDRLAEESFKKLFDFDTNKSQSKQFDYLADREIKGDYSLEEKKDIFKNRFHNIWSSLGKPIFKMSNMFGSKDTDGRWYAQNRKDFTVPYKMKNKDSNPKTIEYHAHKTLGKVIKSAIKGDKKAFDSIKSKSYNDYFGNSVLK